MPASGKEKTTRCIKEVIYCSGDTRVKERGREILRERKIQKKNKGGRADREIERGKDPSHCEWNASPSLCR